MQESDFAAELSATRFVTEILLANLMAALPSAEERQGFQDRILQLAERAADNPGEPALGPLARRTADRIRHIVDRAVERMQSAQGL